MRDVLVLLLVFSTIPMTLLRPHVGILAWCWISYMNPHRLAWGFAYSFPVAMAVGLATLLAWAASKEPKRLAINSVSALLIAFVIWMSFANIFAMVPDLAYEKWEQSFKILLMTFVTMALMGTRERLHALIWVIIASLAFYGIKGGMFAILTGGTGRVWGPPHSFIGDNNALAMALLMVLPLVRYFQLHTEHKLIRLGLYATMMLFAFSIIGSQSRGAFLASGAMIIFLVLKSRRRVVFSAALAVLLAAAAAFAPQQWIERMETIENYEEDSSAMQRLEVWRFALKIASERPLVGGGFRVSYDNDIYLHYIPDSQTGFGLNFHSVYFEILGELGYVGLTIYLAVLLAAWRCGTRIIRLSRNRPDLSWANDLARMTQVSLVGFAAAGAFQNLAFFDLYFHLIAVLFLTEQIVLKELSGQSVQEAALPARATPGRSLASNKLG